MPPSAEALKLRQQLKEWERAFADAHDGRKPTRDEIKKDANIAAKYTEYYKLQPSSKSKPSTSKLSTKPSTESLQSKPAPTPAPARPSPITHDPDNPFASHSTSRPSSSRSTRRPTNDDVFKTPSKTPSKTYNGYDLYDSPLSSRGRRLYGNRLRDTVGPTPQKTGKVLGIFESFIDVETTPTHQRVLQSTPTTGNRCTSGGGRVSVSPAEREGAFTTPRKRKAGELSTAIGSGSEADTPTKPIPNDMFSTPSFLRRGSGRFIGSFEDSPPVPLPMRPPARGLSSMVAELRKMEDDAHKDDEEAMREMEAGGGAPVAKKVKATEKGAVETLENDPDTGLPPPPEGAWKEDEREEEEESGDEKEDKQRKWKKKGLKRQHRRVIMRPVGKTAHVPDEEAPPNPEEVELPGAGYSDEDLSDLDNKPEPGPKDPKKAKTVAGQGTGVVGKVKKAARKISEKAHANYKKLNIRGSKGAKAGKGGGRFSRKRR